MTSSEIRWRCERISQLLRTMGRQEAVATVAFEALASPWIDDPRPAPASMPMGYVHSTEEHDQA